jgi:hypothetical protein
MKELFDNVKKVIISGVMIVALLGATTVHAANASITLTGVNSGVLLSSPVVASQLLVSSSTTNGTLVTFYDNSATNFFYTNASYITTTTSQQTVTNIYTNYFGVLTTNIYPALVTSSVTNAATTNLMPIVATTFVPGSSTAELDGTYQFRSGILVSNSVSAATITVNATYR